MAAYTTIDDPEAHFQVKIYAGTGSELSPTLDGDTDMQPDMVWIKAHNYTSDHRLFDAVRGATKMIKPSENEAEGTESTALTAFNSDGFTVNTSGDVNNSSYDYVAWCWKAGTTGSGTTSGGGTGQAYSFSANTTAGFSITQYEGNGTDAHTIPHSLGVIPTVVWTKNIDGANGWFCMTPNGTTDPWTDFMYLDLNNATADEDTAWSDDQPTSSVVTLGNAGSCNTNANTYMMYAWTPIQGYSKFGTYTGNGNGDGTFVYLGFRPAWVVVKRTDSANNWLGWDNKRLGYNPDNDGFLLQTNDQAETNDRLDFVSNGFKIRSTSSAVGASGATFVYMAFAEAPFVNSNGVPCNAR